MQYNMANSRHSGRQRICRTQSFCILKLCAFCLTRSHFPPLAPGSPQSTLCFNDLTLLDSLCEWHPEFLFLWSGLCITQHNAFQVHPWCCTWHNFLLFFFFLKRLNNIPLYVSVTFSLSSQPWMALELFPCLGYCE